MKTCTYCNEAKPKSEYYSRPDTGGLKARCKECECLMSRARNYGVSVEEALDYMNTTNCDCCGKHLVDKRHTYIDHSHTTGEIRGVLCMSCNSGIGFLGDNVEGLQQALNYLTKNN